MHLPKEENKKKKQKKKRKEKKQRRRACIYVVGEVGVPILSFTTSYPTSAVINY